ncbi:cytochrome b5 reductase 4 isoform X2 [Contarinia nasturtii]|uniref:cytochrome b5 reductase 4 isoform X2 n=1 Tax=Contarinia nasturtii TaxID=265458 RepID=UPI0012D40E93|nr:cytochrome b5 reductase 4 isoform X2 [Contarinia nasturtii]
MLLCWRKRRNNKRSSISSRVNASSSDDEYGSGVNSPPLISNVVAMVKSIDDNSTEHFEKSNPRNKCALQPGHSLMDWVRLGNSNYDLAGTKGVIRAISYEELAKHNKNDDCWLAIRGKVYNVTKYMDFHPGGVDELMKGAGKDATKLFDDVHAWVNYEQLLCKCFVGPLRTTLTINLDVSGNSSRAKSINQLASSTTPNGCFKAPFLPILNTVSSGSNNKSPTTAKSNDDTQSQSTESSLSTMPIEIVPRFDWIQKTNELSLVFYTKAFCNPALLIRCITQSPQSKFEIGIQIEQTMHINQFQLADQVAFPPLATKINYETGKIECIFQKNVPALWTNFGLMTRQKLTDLSNCTYLYNVIERVQITHDSYALVLQPKQSLIQILPIGHHISVTANVEGTNITRSYTPVPKTYAPISCNKPEADPSFYLYLLIKTYVNGALTTHLTNNLPLAHDLEISYAKGNFKLNQVKEFTRIAILAAGSGITPMLAIIDYLLERRSNRVESISMLYFNKTTDDIWCRSNLDLLTDKNNRFQVRYVLSEPNDDEDWHGDIGRMSEELAASLLKLDSKFYSEFCFVCGPLPFNQLCEKTLRSVGFDDKRTHFFRG